MKKILWLIIIVIVAYFIWQYLETRNLLRPFLPSVSPSDTTGQINQDLNQIDILDVNQELEAIDAELNNL